MLTLVLRWYILGQLNSQIYKQNSGKLSIMLVYIWSFLVFKYSTIMFSSICITLIFIMWFSQVLRISNEYTVDWYAFVCSSIQSFDF